MKNNEEESKFMQLWHNKRTHAAMVLGMWMVFLLFVIIISFVGGKSKPSSNLNNNNNYEQKEEVITFKDYSLMQDDLLKNNYKYEYNIKIGDYEVIYKGEKLGVKETGYRENSIETIKYYIDETGLYTVVMNSLNSNDRLYENLNESLIDLESIFELVKDKTVITEEMESSRTYKYIFTLEDINYNIVITTNTEYIENINISLDDKIYDFKFMEINKLQKLSYEPIEVN